MKFILRNDFIDNFQRNRRGITLLFTFCCMFAVLCSQICIIKTTSDSIPYSWCLQVYNLKPKKGDLCVFNFKGRKFLKYIAGTEGDEIQCIGKAVYVGDNRIGICKETGFLTPTRERKVPKGYVFVAGTHPDSFDSRYEEFGLIKESDVEGKAFGLVKYKEKKK